MTNGPSVNYNSPEWQKVEDWLKAELQETLLRLAGLTVTNDETQQLRGRASFITMMLDLKNDAAATYSPR